MALAGKTTAIVMAGRREGALDPLAEAAGLADKCLVPVGGTPMITHVLAALAAVPAIGRIIVSVNDVRTLDGIPLAQSLLAAGRLTVVPASVDIVQSLFAAADQAEFPVLVTTADNVLLTPMATAAFLDGLAVGDDVGVAFARRASVLAAHPDGQRRFYRFTDDSYSNCNTYWIGRREALKSAKIFRSGGQFAKHPMRIAMALGVMNLIRFRYGIGTLDDAFRRFSRRFRLKIRAIALEDGAAAIDVDNPRTLAVAETILAGRSQAAIRAVAAG
jgi:GTP:adenosylcobinamide-phosphate guanylyltransferase